MERRSKESASATRSIHTYTSLSSFFFASVLCLTTGEKDRDRPRFSTRPAATDGLVSISNTRPNPRNGWMLSSFDSRGKAKGVELERSGSRGEEQKTTAIGGTRL
jgi:hypothetical protein